MIRKLSQEVVNQIAAGEVVERPASVIKELMDNSIDAGASKIDIRIKSGGKKHLEIADDGVGIEKEDLKKVFEAHTTSKIQNIEDLDNILSMGFRGEALSTIVAVSKVSMISKHRDAMYAYEVYGQGTKLSDPGKKPRDFGTTIIVKDLFGDIPARFKYLRTDDTEYRKILEVVLQYFLIYPNVHFTFSNNGKQIYNLPKISGAKSGDIIGNRIQNVLSGNFTKDMLPVFYDGDGMKISGFVARPEYNYERTQHQYCFLNKRAIYDGGIAKGVSQGCAGFIPTNKRIPFIIHIEMNPSLVDVNVHPRKEEVRFANPYRVYSGVQRAVQESLKGYSISETQLPSFSQTPNLETNTMSDAPKKSREINYKRDSSYNIQSGLKFSEHLLKPNVVRQQDMSLFKQESDNNLPCFQIFNKYILVQFENEIWVIDQHAASERIHYENLKKSLEVQSLLVPVEINLSEIESSYLKENIGVFEKFGFKVTLENNNLHVFEIPFNLSNADLDVFFKELLSQEDVLEKMTDIQEHLLFVVACHASIRSGQRLSEFEMKNLVKDLRKCDNATSCPHGRPIIWKLKIEELDKKFYRTY